MLSWLVMCLMTVLVLSDSTSYTCRGCLVAQHVVENGIAGGCSYSCSSRVWTARGFKASRVVAGLANHRREAPWFRNGRDGAPMHGGGYSMTSRHAKAGEAIGLQAVPEGYGALV